MSIKEVHGRDGWSQALVPDVYFTKEYYAASGLLEPDFSSIELVEWSDGNGTVKLPLILRRIQDSEYFDATSAYGYGGPWVVGDPNLSNFLEYFEYWAKSKSIVSTFLRFHPLIDNAEVFQDFVPLQKIGLTAGWDLSQDKDLVAGMAKGHRKTWRRAINAGVEARVTENPANVVSFVELYRKTMDRLSAGSFYRFSDEYWDSLRSLLQDRTLLVEAVFEDRVVASAWCIFSEEFLHFHLSGTSDEGRKLGGAVICRVAAAKWAQEKQMKFAHHGGGVGGENSTLLDWKRKFDEGLPLFNFSVAQMIHDKKTFDVLSEGFSTNGYFPPWRAPKV